MIRVIAGDMDGTLLNEKHLLNERTIQAIISAQKAGIRFVAATGRTFEHAMRVFKDSGIACDYIVNSGAEIRNSKHEILRSAYMNVQDCIGVYNVLKKYDLMYLFVSEDIDYCIGNTKNREKELIQHILTFEKGMTEKEARETSLFKDMLSKTKVVSSFDELLSSEQPITKVFAVSDDLSMLKEIKEQFKEIKNIAVSSSFENNLEVTDIKAQKGIALKNYIEYLGYTMDEVMVFGDSMNDYSMISMDFGATVAVENAVEKVKQAAKYVTKSNKEDGVAYVIEELLKRM